MSSLSIAADIGGTNTRIAVIHRDTLNREHVWSFKNSEFNGFNDLLSRIMRDHPARELYIALAGPVEGRRGELTNLAWHIDADAMARQWHLDHCALINDLQAQGWGAACCQGDQKRTILKGQKIDGASTLVLGVGTGCNIAVNHAAHNARIVPPAEAGHIDFPVKCQEDFDFLMFLKNTNRETSLEGLMSGRGLIRCYEYFSGDPKQSAHDIIDAAHQDPQSAAGKTVQFMRRKLGDALGDLALIHLPFGGVYLIGGVARSLAGFQDPNFKAAFYDKGRFAQFMRQFQVEVITDDFAALEGLNAYRRSARG